MLRSVTWSISDIRRARRRGCMDVRGVYQTPGAAVAVGACHANLLSLLASDRVRGMFTPFRALCERISAELFHFSVTSPTSLAPPFSLTFTPKISCATFKKGAMSARPNISKYRR